MFPGNYEKYTEDDIRLIKDFLEKFIGQSWENCRILATQENFIMLDTWNEKMGFVKEEKNKYQILSLQFEEATCQSYQLLIKESDQKWSESRKIDYQSVRDAGFLE